MELSSILILGAPDGGSWSGRRTDDPHLADDPALRGLNQLKSVLGNCKPDGATVRHNGSTAIHSTAALQVSMTADGSIDAFSVPRLGPLHIIALDFSQAGAGTRRSEASIDRTSLRRPGEATVRGAVKPCLIREHSSDVGFA